MIGNVTTVAGNGTQGIPSLTPGLKATSQALNTPRGVAVDPSQNTVYIAVRIFNVVPASNTDS